MLDLASYACSAILLGISASDCRSWDAQAVALATALLLSVGLALMVLFGERRPGGSHRRRASSDSEAA